MMMFIQKKFIFTFVLLCAAISMVKSEGECDADIEATMELLLSPNPQPSMQVQALRRELIRRLTDALRSETNEFELYQQKRSFSSLAQWNNLPGKKSLESLARGGYLRPRSDDNDSNLKRSISTLAKNGQLPNYQGDDDDVDKRGIQSLARNGDLHHKREIQELISDLTDKRNVGSLARSYNFPTTFGKRFFYDFGDKRNVASLAREGMKINGKRDGFWTDSDEQSQKSEAAKKNIASIKAQYKPKFKRSVVEKDGKRQKRDVDYYDINNDEYSSPVYQKQNVVDYEEMLKELADEYPNAEKRFLGSVARSGWFRPSSSSRYLSASKRHIGSLARLGWLPSFRSIRRFSRSGRSANECDPRTTSSDGQVEDDSFAQNALSINDKRFLLQPAVDKILLQKLFKHPMVFQ